MSKILLSIYLSVTFSPPLIVNLEIHRAENRWPLNIKISTRCIRVDRDPVLDPWPSVRQTETITAGYLFKRRSEMDVSIVPSRFHAPFALLNPRPPHSISLRYPKKVDKLCVTRDVESFEGDEEEWCVSFFFEASEFLGRYFGLTSFGSSCFWFLLLLIHYYIFMQVM